MTTLTTLITVLLLQLLPVSNTIYLPQVQRQVESVSLSEIAISSSTDDNLLTVSGVVRNQTTDMLLNLLLIVNFYQDQTLIQSSSVVIAGWVQPGEQARFEVTIGEPDVWGYVLLNLRWQLQNGGQGAVENFYDGR